MGSGSILAKDHRMTLPAPFIYISALMRTGSTMLSETLTELPRGYIFNEPHLGKNTFSLSSPDAERLRAYGIDLQTFLRFRLWLAFLLRRVRTIWPKQDFMIEQVKHTLLPELRKIGLQQAGVKEIKHEGWQHYVRHFPELKMVMLGRDPRDLYISAYRKWQKGTTLWHGPFTPDSAAEQLKAQFLRQLKMRNHVDCLDVRYEELCTDPRVLQKVRSFSESPLDRAGNVGEFIRSHPKRRDEYQKHGPTISNQSVNRWQRENEGPLLDDARRFAALMAEYTAFWGYDA